MRRYNSGTGRLHIGQPLSLLTRRLINTVSNVVSNSRISKPSNSPLGNGIGIGITKTWRHSRLKVLGASLLTAIATIALAIPALTNTSSAYTADAFVMVVKTDNPGTSNATSFTIPITGAGYSYNVDCNDDGINEVTARTTSYTCVYATAGTYTLAITGTFPRIYFNNAGDRQKLLEVKQWGTIAWTSMANAFYGCNNLHVTATDAPNLSGVTSLASMFREATSMNENINHWNTSTITDMSYIFAGHWFPSSTFNQPLADWDTSAVTDMSFMFSGASAFNQSLSNWDTGAVINMSSMFSGASAFNQPLADWDTSAVTDMSFMFSGASAFNQSLSNWDTGAVINMSSMFQVASAFNQPLNSWNTSAVIKMNGMFYRAIAFNQPLSNWNTSVVTNMARMFNGTNTFNQPLNSWNTSAVTDMSSMFSGAITFNQPLSNWDTSAVTDMSTMFYGASAFNQPLTGWNTAAVTNMNAMFDYSGLSTANYDQTLVYLASQTVQPSLTFGAVGASFCNEAARAILIAAPNNWTITDGGYCQPTVIAPGHLTITALDRPIVSGTVAPNRTVHLAIAGNTYTTTADGTGAFSITLPNALADGWHALSVRSTDSSGNPGVETLVSFNVHTGGSLALSGTALQPTLSWQAIPSLSARAQWSQTASGASSFPARGSFGAAELNGKLWVVGGKGASGRLNDVWSSPDGVTWTRELASAPWSARNAHMVTAFNGKLWVMGGSTSSGSLNDVWSSPDGINWTQETSSASWSKRYGHEVVVHKDKLWLIGGAPSTGGFERDVWSSSDGITWTLINPAASWSVRSGFAAASYNGKLWVMGGTDDGGSPFMNDVWSSTDGTTWTEETSSAAWPVRASHQVEVFDDKLWVLGGSTDAWDSEYSDVWFSENGKDWIRTAEAADWPARRGHTSAVFNDKLWVLGGRVGSSWTLSNDVWRADTPPVTYSVCWDTVEGGCAHTATTDGTPSFTIPNNLAIGTWYFKVQATDPQGKPLGSYTSSAYTLTKPAPVTSPIANAPTLNPLTKQASSAVLPAALTGASLAISSYQCTTHQPSIALYEPGNLQAPDTNVTLLGGIGFSLNCANNGDIADVAIALGTGYRDTAKLRAYKQSGNSLVDITDQVQFTTALTANNTWQTTISYQLVDGGALDEDGTANGTIVDPIYIGTLPGAEEMLAATGVNIWLLGGGGALMLVVGAATFTTIRRRFDYSKPVML